MRVRLLVYSLMLAVIVLASSLPCKVAQMGDGDLIVSAEGSAACTGSFESYRRAALGDALRRAVENAVGVMVTGRTRTRNYQLVEDAVRTSSEGFVKSYEIAEEREDRGVYRVRIEARVAPATPEQSLRGMCRRLKEEMDPQFRVTVAGDPPIAESSRRTVIGELTRVGLVARDLSDQSDSSDRSDTLAVPAIRINGRVHADPLGEPVEGSRLYSASASAALSAVDASSGAVLPAIPVELPQPVTAVSQETANRRAAEAVCRLWIERNLPLIALALLEPGEQMTEPAGDLKADAPSSGGGTPVALPETEPGSAAAQLAGKLRESVLKTSEFASLPVEVCVARFRPIGLSDDRLADDLLEDLSTSLVKTGVFQLVERGELDKVLEELRIQNSGLIDSATARKLGKLVGAKAVLVGSISDRGDRIVINARLINTESGRVRIAESVVLDKAPEPLILRSGKDRKR